MKKIFHKLMPLGFIMLAFMACKKDEVQTTVKTVGTGGTLSTSANELVLDKTMLDQEVVRFNLTEADFGYDAAVSNVLQVAVKGTDFANAKEVILTAKADTAVYNGLDFNNLLLGLGLPPSVSSDIELRIKSSVSLELDPVYSNVVSMKAQPFPLTAYIYVPGAYQGWAPATAERLVSLTGNGIYVGTILFDGGNFKITPERNWTVAYGDAGGGKISTTGGDIYSGPAGLKELIVDLNAKTFTIAPVMWSIVGDGTASGWPPASGAYNELDMQFANGKWTKTLTLLNGQIKFRKNHAWTTSLGGDGNGNATDANITVTAGNYTITLDVLNKKYTLVKN